MKKISVIRVVLVTFYLLIVGYIQTGYAGIEQYLHNINVREKEFIIPLASTDFTDEMAKELQERLKLDPSIVGLSIFLRWMDDDPSTPQSALLRLLQNLTNTNLRSIRITRLNLGVDAANIICDFLRRNPSITDVDIFNDNTFSLEDDETGVAEEKAQQAILTTLADRANLTRFVWKGFHKVTVTPMLLEMLRQNTRLTSIEFNLAFFNDPTGIIDALQHHRQLTSICMERLTDPCYISINTLLRQNPKLTHIDFRGTSFTPAAMKALTDTLEGHQQLTSIGLSECSLASGGLRYISTLLEQHRNLTHIDFSHNKFTPADMEELTHLLQGHQQLTSINFESCELGSPHIEAIVKFLKQHPNLTEINFSNKHSYAPQIFSTRDIEAIAHALEGNQQLTRIYFGRGVLDNLDAICNLFRQHHNLVEVELSNSNGHPFNLTEIQKIKDALNENMALIKIKLDYPNEVENKKNIQCVKKIVERNRSLEWLYNILNCRLCNSIAHFSDSPAAFSGKDILRLIAINALSVDNRKVYLDLIRRGALGEQFCLRKEELRLLFRFLELQNQIDGTEGAYPSVVPSPEVAEEAAQPDSSWSRVWPDYRQFLPPPPFGWVPSPPEPVQPTSSSSSSSGSTITGVYSSFAPPSGIVGFPHGMLPWPSDMQGTRAATNEVTPDWLIGRGEGYVLGGGGNNRISRLLAQQPNLTTSHEIHTDRKRVSRETVSTDSRSSEEQKEDKRPRTEQEERIPQDVKDSCEALLQMLDPEGKSLLVGLVNSFGQGTVEKKMLDDIIRILHTVDVSKRNLAIKALLQSHLQLSKVRNYEELEKLIYNLIRNASSSSSSSSSSALPHPLPSRNPDLTPDQQQVAEWLRTLGPPTSFLEGPIEGLDWVPYYMFMPAELDPSGSTTTSTTSPSVVSSAVTAPATSALVGGLPTSEVLEPALRLPTNARPTARMP